MNQMLPSLSSTRPCGPDPASCSGNSLIWPGLRIEPAEHVGELPGPPDRSVRARRADRAAASPSVGTTHSLNDTFAGPAITTAAGAGFGGKCVARYAAIGIGLIASAARPSSRTARATLRRYCPRSR